MYAYKYIYIYVFVCVCIYISPDKGELFKLLVASRNFMAEILCS